MFWLSKYMPSASDWHVLSTVEMSRSTISIQKSKRQEAIHSNNTKKVGPKVDASAQVPVQTPSQTKRAHNTICNQPICQLTSRLKLKVVNVPPGQLKVRSLLRLAGAMEEQEAVLLVDDEDESTVVDAAIVDGAGHADACVCVCV